MTRTLIYVAVFAAAVVAFRYSKIISAQHRALISDRTILAFAGMLVVVAAFVAAFVAGKDTPLPGVALAVGAGAAVGILLTLGSLRRHEALEDQLNEAIKDMVVTREDGTVADPRDSDGRRRVLTPAHERKVRRARHRGPR